MADLLKPYIVKMSSMSLSHEFCDKDISLGLEIDPFDAPNDAILG